MDCIGLKYVAIISDKTFYFIWPWKYYHLKMVDFHWPEIFEDNISVISKSLVNAKLLLVGQFLTDGKLLAVNKYLVDSNLFSVGKC